MRALLLAASFLLALAAVPMASAAPQVCPEKTEYQNGGITVQTHSDCSVVITEQAYECFWGGHYTNTKVGPVLLRTYSCDPEHPPL